MATFASGNLVRLFGISAEIDGDIIRIAAGTFVVADSCAGLRFFLAGLAIGAFYALVLVRRWRVQIAVVGLAAVIAVVGNWIRIATLIVIGHVTDMQSGLIARHLGFGWVIFTLGLVPFFLLARVIEKRADRKYAGSEPESAGMDPEVETGEPKAVSRRFVWRAAAATAVAVVGPVLYFVFGALPAVTAGEGGLEDVARGDPWRIAESPVERPFGWRPAYQGADQHDSLAFSDGERMVYGDRFVYRKQAQGAKLIGFPNRIAPRADIFEERLMGPVDPARGLWVQQAVVITPEGPVLVWYWYRVGGVDTFSPVYAKVLEVPAFLSRRRASELVALSAACEADNCRDAFQALAGFMGVRISDASGGEPVEASDTTEAPEATEEPPSGNPVPGRGPEPGFPL
jgi:exosortase/archaeosortase family protein